MHGGEGCGYGRQREGLCALKKRETIDSDKHGEIMNKENDCGEDSLAHAPQCFFRGLACILGCPKPFSHTY